MAYSEEARQYANRILERRREYYLQESRRKNEEIRVKCNGFTELENYRKELNLKKLRATLGHNDTEVSEIRKELEAVSSEIIALLERNGYSSDDLKEQHGCSVCGDTGITKDGSLCNCKKVLLQKFEREKLISRSPLSMCSFDNFVLDYYSDIALNGDVSPRLLMRENYIRCKEYALSFPTSDNILLIGSTGLGKTHLALSIANVVLSKGFEVLYCSCSNVFQIIDEERNLNRTSDTMNSIKRCDLLILDDLGSEFINSYYNAMLYDLINSRLSEQKPSVITSNLEDPEKFRLRYGEKITYRLLGCFELLPCRGDDIRTQELLT